MLSKPSKCLQFLLRRTQRMQMKPKRKVEPSNDQMFLLNRMAARRWKKHEVAEMTALIRQMVGEIKTINHYLNCEQCRWEICLNIERYMGTRLWWWYDLQNDVATLKDEYPEFADCPDVNDYYIGSYWTRDEGGPDVFRFIEDRGRWAEKLIRQQLVEACSYLKEVIHWNLDLNNVPEFWIPGIFYHNLSIPNFLG